jgi:hypothetical protein
VQVGGDDAADHVAERDVEAPGERFPLLPMRARRRPGDGIDERTDECESSAEDARQADNGNRNEGNNEQDGAGDRESRPAIHRSTTGGVRQQDPGAQETDESGRHLGQVIPVQVDLPHKCPKHRQRPEESSDAAKAARTTTWTNRP